jgi:hypothetical protein
MRVNSRLEMWLAHAGRHPLTAFTRSPAAAKVIAKPLRFMQSCG